MPGEQCFSDEDTQTFSESMYGRTNFSIGSPVVEVADFAGHQMSSPRMADNASVGLS